MSASRSPTDSAAAFRSTPEDPEEHEERSPLAPPADLDLSAIGAELAFVQEVDGRFVSFFWREAPAQNLSIPAILAQTIDQPVFSPVGIPEYLDRIHAVLSNGTPERFMSRFAWGDQQRSFDLVASPLLLADGHALQVLVTGRSIPSLYASSEQSATALPNVTSGLDAHQKLLSKIARSIRRTLPLSSALYQILLTKIARNIRKTLDLDTIWQQTVLGLGQALSVSRCTICTAPNSDGTSRVVAEYAQEGCLTMLGRDLPAGSGTLLATALTSDDPVPFDSNTADSFGNQSSIAVATRYQGKPNAILCLYQCDRIRHWTAAEIELMRELADQVGTAIAHAKLFAESQALATELQAKNINLVQQQQELEEARKQAEEVSRLKSEFLANTSHEIRTPLNGVIGFLKLILDDMVDDPEEQQEFLQEAYRSAVHLLDILNDILDIARIEADKLELHLEPVKLGELFRNAENFTQAQIQQKGLYFEADIPETRDEIILYGDYQRLLQVMLNLIGNAIKFTHEGGVTVGAELMRKKVAVQGRELPGVVRIRVADTGIGVSLDKQDKLFQSFSQVDGSRTRRYGGTGLGLVISQKLIEAMGGTVNFYSLGEGLGSTVTFDVPLYQEPLVVNVNKSAAHTASS